MPQYYRRFDLQHVKKSRNEVGIVANRAQPFDARRAAMAGQIERDRTMLGAERVDLAMPGVAVRAGAVNEQNLAAA